MGLYWKQRHLLSEYWNDKFLLADNFNNWCFMHAIIEVVLLSISQTFLYCTATIVLVISKCVEVPQETSLMQNNLNQN